MALPDGIYAIEGRNELFVVQDGFRHLVGDWDMDIVRHFGEDARHYGQIIPSANAAALSSLPPRDRAMLHKGSLAHPHLAALYATNQLAADPFFQALSEGEKIARGNELKASLNVHAHPEANAKAVAAMTAALAGAGPQGMAAAAMATDGGIMGWLRSLPLPVLVGAAVGADLIFGKD